MFSDPLTTPLPRLEGDAVAGAEPPNRARGGQPGNRNTRKHGLYAKDAGRVDMRRREDRAVFSTVQAIEEDLGGSSAISAQRKVILDGIARKLRDLFKIEAYLGGLTSIVNKRRRCLLPVVLEKHRLLESIARDLERVGLERRKRDPLDLKAYLAERTPAAQEPRNGDGPEQRSDAPADAATAMPEGAAGES